MVPDQVTYVHMRTQHKENGVMRKTTGQVLVGDLLIGGGAPVSIQSMLNRPSEDIEGNVLQAKEHT